MADISDKDSKPVQKRPKSALDFASYEEYLSSMVTDLDLFYLEDVCLARKIVELGYTGNKETHSPVQFFMDKAKFEYEKAILHMALGKILLSAGKAYEPGLLKAMQIREESARIGKNSCIFFIRDRNEQGHEISGYIDYNVRLSTDDMRPFFDGSKKFLPKLGDLSFYNWDTCVLRSKDTVNYEILKDTGGLNCMMLRNKRDSKVLNLDPYLKLPGGNSSRTIVSDPNYISVVVFDHYNRRRL